MYFIRNHGFWLSCSVAVLISLPSSGCGNQRRTAEPVDPVVARSTLRVALDAWKEGKSPADLGTHKPTIVAQDADWTRGARLDAYEVLDAGEEKDANLECRVRLSLVDVNGKPIERSVIYVVGTAPVLTVFRKVSF